ncbi:hypothetical protein AK830_g5444 [Neonectria ditissima]|uniref:Uncharacterized protein n=1 Tax=Neonectria ditissima TaxID=78410 RepID=A0A0P7BED4_9HYPO|nr:hypothetical protein AK830_g5444 [Neonectria ditissima]
MAQEIPRKVIVVIGVGGMGLPICRRLASGRRLLLADYLVENLKTALAALSSEGYSVEGFVANIVEYSAVRQLAVKAASLGQIEAIVHTAGVSPSIASAKQIFAVDLLGTANVIEAFLPSASPGTSLHLATAPLDQLLQHKGIDFEGSNPGMAYALAKRGNQLRVQAAARAWGSKGARLNSVSPGVISTVLGQKELQGGASAMVELSAARRMGTAEDIVNAVAFLTGPGSDYITGNDILVDGGTVAGRRWHT